MITFTVTDAGNAISTITIDGTSYNSGDAYTITSTDPLTIIVTTTESGKTTAVRTFTVLVNQAPYATAPSDIELATCSMGGKGVPASCPKGVFPVGGVTNVAIPTPGGTDTTGAVTGWVGPGKFEADMITFTVTDAGGKTPITTSTITIDGAPYTSGDWYTITGTTPLTIIVTTDETGRATAVRMFIVTVSPPLPITGIGSIIGTPEVGQTLTAGDLIPLGATASYQWQEATSPNGTYTNIIGKATSNTYTVQPSDVGNYIEVVATGLNNSTATSSPTAVVTLAPINRAEIDGVTAPVTGVTPAAITAGSGEYTGTVSWNPNNNPFVVSTTYTATITITPDNGYTLTGVPADFFTVPGATTVTNDANSGVVTAVFPETDIFQTPFSRKAGIV
jgi:hypothetical protein